jgi:hypothetical protein
MKFTKVEVRIDSIEVVNDIMHKKPSRMSGKAQVTKICQLLVFHWEVVVRHTYCETNFSVNDEVCFFQDCPDFCKHRLDADEKGFVIPRNVFV